MKGGRSFLVGAVFTRRSIVKAMFTLEICFSPAELPSFALEGKVAVVTDVFRATSSMAAGLWSGVARIVPVTRIEDCAPYRERGYLAAGERGGERIEGFELGNSPYDFMAEGAKGRSIVMTTTNGTNAIHQSSGAERVLIGAFVNLTATVNAIREAKMDAVIVCAGWRGRFSMEDALFAGAAVETLGEDYRAEDDASMVAKLLWQQAKQDLRGFLEEASHARRLSRLGAQQDANLCTQLDACPAAVGVERGAVVRLDM